MSSNDYSPVSVFRVFDIRGLQSSIEGGFRLEDVSNFTFSFLSLGLKTRLSRYRICRKFIHRQDPLEDKSMT